MMPEPKLATRSPATLLIALTMIRQQQRGRLQRRLPQVSPIEERMALRVSALLRAGVAMAAAIVVGGAVLYLSRHGGERPLYQVFHSEPDSLRRVFEIFPAAFAGSGRAVMQVGLLVLIATPIARVVLALFTFVAARDRTYSFIAGTVLVTLLLGLAGGTL